MKIFSTLIIACAITLVGCSGSNKVVLKSKDGKRELVYDCSNFLPRVETGEDIALLVQEAAQTLKDAASAKEFVSIQEITDALNKQDWRRLERSVVTYRCAHK